MYEIKAIVRLDRQEDVIAALHAVPDLPGLTVFAVEGIGRRRAGAADPAGDFGRTTMAQIEMVVGDRHLAPVLEAIARSARTGRAGDGKVFISQIDDAIRLRTGETGLDALH